MADRYLHVNGFGDFPITESEAQRLEDGKSITINISKPPKDLLNLLFGEEVEDPCAREYTAEDMGFRPGRLHVDSVNHPNPAIDTKRVADYMNRRYSYKDTSTDVETGPKDDPVNHPAHYTEGRTISPADVADDWDMDRWTFSAFKYIARAGRKDDEIQDLEKAVWYLNRRISLLKGES